MANTIDGLTRNYINRVNDILTETDATLAQIEFEQRVKEKVRSDFQPKIDAAMRRYDWAEVERLENKRDQTIRTLIS